MKAPLGLLVTGGRSGQELASSEIYKDGRWICGPRFSFTISCHCQAQYEGTPIIAGKDKQSNVI